MIQTDQQTIEEQNLTPITKYKASIYQKYMIIRLNDILLRKQIRNGFDMLLKTQQPEQLKRAKSSTVQQEEVKYYTVELEIIRPKLRGEVLFNKTFNVSDLKIPKKINKLYITKPSDSIAQFKSESNEMESKTKVQDLKQLIQLQRTMKDSQFNQQKPKSPKSQIGIYQILVLVFVLYILFLIL